MGGYALYAKVGNVDVFHVLILRMEIIALPVLIKAEAFQRVLVFIGKGDDNISDIGGLLLPYDNKVAVVDLRFDHRITGGAESVEISFAEDRYGERKIFLDLCLALLRRTAGNRTDNRGRSDLRAHHLYLGGREYAVFVGHHIPVRHSHKVSVGRGYRYLHRSVNLTDGRRRRIPLVVALDVILDAEH